MYTKSDIMQMVEEEDVEFIRLQFTDIFGNMKNVAITSSQLEKALDNRCMFDGSSIEGFVGIEESDMYLHPDLDSFTIFPWRPQQGKVARIICDIYRPDGTPFEGDPRYILRRVVKEAEDMGYVLMWDRSVNFSCLIRMITDARLRRLPKRPAILRWDQMIMAKMQDVTWC